MFLLAREHHIEHPLDSASANAGPGSRWLYRHATGLGRLASYRLLPGGRALPLSPGAQSRAYIGLLEDDYYYYAIIADKLLTLGKLTYDGTTLTNGVPSALVRHHPALRAVCGSFSPMFYLALTLVAWLSMCLTYELATVCRRSRRVTWPVGGRRRGAHSARRSCWPKVWSAWWRCRCSCGCWSNCPERARSARAAPPGSA